MIARRARLESRTPLRRKTKLRDRRSRLAQVRKSPRRRHRVTPWWWAGCPAC